MRIGVPKEVKNHEYRVAMTPAGVHELVVHGHDVLVEAGAGIGSSIPDEQYAEAGAKLVASADDVWGDAEMVLKVKEPVKEEYHRMREGQVLFTYLHLAADRPLTRELMDRGELHATLRFRRMDGSAREIEYHVTKEGAGPGRHLAVVREIDVA